VDTTVESVFEREAKELTKMIMRKVASQIQPYALKNQNQSWEPSPAKGEASPAETSNSAEFFRLAEQALSSQNKPIEERMTLIEKMLIVLVRQAIYHRGLPGPAGKDGVGLKGDKGDVGAPGRTTGADELRQLISQFFHENRDAFRGEPGIPGA